MLTIDHHAYTNHNGGQLAFGPEGDLYIGVGDGGSEDDPDNNGQNTDTLLGKILRIAPDGGRRLHDPGAATRSPARRGKRAEIWAYGLRNPWRFSFDRTTGDLIIGDVGQDQRGGDRLRRAGHRRGRQLRLERLGGRPPQQAGQRAAAPSPGADAPRTATATARSSAATSCATARCRASYGRYLFGDYCRPQIESVKLARGHATGLRATGLDVPVLSSFGQDASGHIYVASLNGAVYRLAER